jgi:branched-chain amino acid transport system substrate-binding protein
MSIRTRRSVCVVLGLVLGGCAATPDPPPAESVVLGVLADTSGSGAEVGAEAVRGAELAVELVNQPHPDVGVPLATGTGLPGMAGAQVRLVVGDTGGDPDAAEATVDELAAAGPVAALVASDSVDVVEVAAAYAARREVPFVDAATSADHLLDLGLDWYFRLGPADRMLAETVFALLRADPPPGDGRAVLLTAASDAGAGVAGLARGAGLTVVQTVQVDAGGQDQARIQLVEAAPEVVVAVAATRAQARLLDEVLAGVEPSSVVVALGSGFDPSQNVGLVGAVRPVAWSDEFASRHPLATTVDDLYEARYEQPMTGAAAAGFTAVLTAAVAVDAAGAGDPATVRVGLRQLSVPATRLVMPWLGVEFAANGQNESAAVLVEQRTGQGWQVVFPEELAAGPVAWPDPSPSRDSGVTP